jgi:hypothetical protein
MAKGWSRKFDDPIDLARGRQLATLQDAGNYITGLPRTEHMAPEWQTAMQALMIVARGGPTMLARIGFMQALPRWRGLRRNPRVAAATPIHRSCTTPAKRSIKSLTQRFSL